MKKIIPLIMNENMKIYRRPQAWVMFTLLMLSVAGTGLFAKYAFVLEPRSLWEFMISNAGLIHVVTLFSTVIASGIVSAEYTHGTIKLLLIRPVHRSKILFAKYGATLLYASFLLVSLFAFSFLFGGLLLGFQPLFAPFSLEIMGEHVEMHFGHVIGFYLLNSVELVMMVTFALMISTVFRSQSLAVGLVILFMFVGEQIVYFLSQVKGIKYLLFAHLDLTPFIIGRPLIEGLTLPFSIVVLFVYWSLFLMITWIVFIKRDITV